ncbi:MAG TPA: hypothetical protein VFP50_16295 [Anaeromyxobacteraceae bacterium]|nr:hypothetical protein [Anaeromyxobacteraceae bacterium]
MRGEGRGLALAVCVLAGCATTSSSGALRRLEPPAGAAAFGVEFGAARPDVEAALQHAGVTFKQDAGDADALVASACPGAPLAGPCRLLFGPAGLYAAEQDAPAADADALVSAVAKGLGAPRRPAEAGDVLATWEPEGWTMAVARHAELQPPVATLRAEWDAATPPVVEGVPLGRRRTDVELALGLQGATLIQRDEDATSYLGCPRGEAEAISCTVTFRKGRAAAVTEVLPGSADDKGALEAWRSRADAMAKAIGRAAEVRCPSGGPERVGGDCTATWATGRLVVVVGAHRSQGGQHRGAITVYTGYSYPPLGEVDGD